MNKMRRRMQRDRRVNHRGWKYVLRGPEIVRVNDRTGVIVRGYARTILGIARMLPEMSVAEQEEQRLDFAFGNLACTTKHKPSKAAFKQIALERGWSVARFNRWAGLRTWERE